MQTVPPLFEVEVPRSGGGENVEKSKDERSKLKVTARQRSFTLFRMKYRENSSSTPGGEVSRSDGGEEHGNVTASNALFIKKWTAIFFNHSGFDYLYHKYYLII